MIVALAHRPYNVHPTAYVKDILGKSCSGGSGVVVGGRSAQETMKWQKVTAK
jgi:hypothetical protein